MSSEMVLYQEARATFPYLEDLLRQAKGIVDSIHSFDDIQRLLIAGKGDSQHTYRSYITAVRQLYDATGGLSPFAIHASDIESFYDGLLKKGLSKKTAALRIIGLKRYFASIKEQVPFFIGPFESMPDKLVKKMGKVNQGKQKKALTIAEINRLLSWLKAEHPIEYAPIFFLVTSGLRAAEFLSLKWRDLSLSEGTWTADFIAKGGGSATQELYGPAVEALRSVAKAKAKQLLRFGADDAATAWGSPDAPLWPQTYPQLWAMIRRIGEHASARGIVTRELEWSPHLMRRSYASLLYKSGMGLRAIAQKTRHSSIEVLCRHYVSDDDQASPVLAKALGATA